MFRSLRLVVTPRSPALQPTTLFRRAYAASAAPAVEQEAQVEAPSISAAQKHAMNSRVRRDWSVDEVREIYNSPVMDLLYWGGHVHRRHHDPKMVQKCTLLSIKTGGCSEDCSYCAQSSKYDTGLKAEKFMEEDAVLAAARKAKEAGSTRFCMGAAWREPLGKKTNFKKVLHYIKEVRGMGMEVCCTLGMLTPDEARQLQEAGLTAYNHNLDTSKSHYSKVISTRTYEDRLNTLSNVRDAGLTVCCGGIIGLGESHTDRVDLLWTLSTLPKHPESVPVNALVPIRGTPLEDQKPVSVWELIRMIATARIIMPTSMVRLSAGRHRLSHAEQALCFAAGANSIFSGEKLLTAENNGVDSDTIMFDTLGLIPRPANLSAQTEMTA